MPAARFPSLPQSPRSPWMTLTLLLAAIFSLGALQARAATLTVNTTADSSDAAGSCATGATCSLRDAINQAASGDTITFSVTGTITLTSVLPSISTNLTIQGPTTSPGIIISGANTLQILNISSGTIKISNLTIADGHANLGGGIYNRGTLTVTNSTFSDNSASGFSVHRSYGGAIYNAGSLTVTNSTFSGNSDNYFGGAISLNIGGTLTVTNSTFSANSAQYGGGIYNNGGTLTVTNSTFSANSAQSDGGGIYNGGGTLTLTNSIFSANTASTDGGIRIGGSTLTENHNLFDNNTGGDANRTLAATDITAKDPDLLPLGHYGGPTETMLPLPASPAICAGTSTMPAGVTTPTTDQRGFTWNSSCVDIGALQTNYVKATSASLSGSFSGMQDVDLTALSGTVYANPTISSGAAINLIGPGASKLAIDASKAGGYPVVRVNTGAQAALYGITLTGSKSSLSLGGILNLSTLTVINSTISDNFSSGNGPFGGLGGGGITNGGTLTVTNSTISNNSSNATLGGGGIANSGGTVTVTNSTFSRNSYTGNTSVGLGGGIGNYSGTVTVTNSTISNNSSKFGGGIGNFKGTVTVTNSTISDNSSTGTGSLAGGIGNLSGTVTVTNSTISGNSAKNGGGIANGGSLTLANTIVSGNSAATDPDLANAGTYTNNGGNVVGSSTIHLASLGYYGGPTQTMPPLSGSSALNFGTYHAGEPTTDQRGAPRPSTVGAKIDSGSVQISGNPPMIAAVTPNNGPTTGGNSVTITGTGLGSATAVSFGIAPYAIFTINAATSTTPASITAAIDPALAAGTVDVTVVNSSGTSATSSSDQFTYWTPLAITPGSETLNLPYGAAYNQAFTVSGGSGSDTLQDSIAGLSLPTGLTLTPATASTGTSWTLSGTPTTVNLSTTLTLVATDPTYASNTTKGIYGINIVKATPVQTLTTGTSFPYGTSGSLGLLLSASSTGTGVNGPTGTVTYAIDGGTSQTVTLVNGQATFSIPATLPAGPHTVTWTYSGDTNYSIASNTINFSITTATLTITASSGTMIYGGTVPAITPIYKGFVNGDTSASLTTQPTCSTTATSTSSVSSYPSTCSGAVDPNYSITYVAGTVSVTQAPLTITAGSSTMIYGGTVPAITPIYKGFVNGDTSASFTAQPTCSTTATSGSAVSSYPSTCSGAVDPNYSITYVAGKVSVTQATLTITANNATKVYGTANPTFTGTVTGAVNGDTFTKTFATTATTTSSAGTYPITPSVTGANLSDYTVTKVNGTLTVTKATPILQWSAPASIVYGTALSSTQLDATASYNGSPVAGAFTYSPAAGTVPNAGTDTLSATFTPTDATDYTTAMASVTITVTQAASATALTTSTQNANLNANVTFTATVTSATSGTPTGSVQFLDGSSVLGSGTLNSNGDATYTTSKLAAGLHQITAVYQGDANFNGSTSAAIAQIVTAPGFSLTTSTSNLTLKDGQTGKVTLDFDPIGGLKATLQLVCSGLPDYATCTFSPTSLTADGSNQPQTDQITITTKGPNSGTVAAVTHPGKSDGILMAGIFWLPAMFFGAFLFWQRKKLNATYRMLLILLVLAATISGAVGCGSSAIFTSPGASTVKIAATDGTTVHTTTINLQITK